MLSYLRYIVLWLTQVTDIAQLQRDCRSPSSQRSPVPTLTSFDVCLTYSLTYFSLMCRVWQCCRTRVPVLQCYSWAAPALALTLTPDLNPNLNLYPNPNPMFLDGSEPLQCQVFFCNITQIHNKERVVWCTVISMLTWTVLTSDLTPVHLASGF